MQSRTSRRLVPALIVTAVLSFGVAAYSAAELGLIGGPRFHGTAYHDAPTAPDFTLTDHSGRPVSLSDLRGRAVLLFFGFTRCPDVCPLTLRRLADVATDFEPDEIEIVLVTVDPENDTPGVLASYIEPFGPAVTGLTGDRTTLETVFEEYGVYARTTTGHSGEPMLAHTTQVFGIDAAGRLRVLIHADEPREIVASDVRSLLRAGS